MSGNLKASTPPQSFDKQEDVDHCKNCPAACKIVFGPLFSLDSLAPASWKEKNLVAPRKLAPTFYGISSFYYSICGILMFTVFSQEFKRAPQIPYPIEIQASLLVLQSVATFLADVCYVGRRSIFHAGDRILATFNTIFIMTNWIFINWLERGYFAIVFLSGIQCFICSRLSREEITANYKMYLFWHHWWHAVFPSGLALWLLHRHIIASGGASFGVVVLCASGVIFAVAGICTYRYRTRLSIASRALSSKMPKTNVRV